MKLQIRHASSSHNYSEKSKWVIGATVCQAAGGLHTSGGQDQHSVNSENTYCSLISQSPLEPANFPLDSPSGVQQCVGQILNTVSYKGKTHPLTVFVIRGGCVNNCSAACCQ